MTVDNENPPDALLTALKASGFPFQTAVTQVIRATEGWAVHASEYPWRGTEKDDRFLDIVAISKRLILTVECKKTRHEIFIFLRPIGSGGSSPGHIDDFRCLCVAETKLFMGTVQAINGDWNLWPKSPSCEFCIVGSATSGSQRMLEKDAGSLIRATNAFAVDLHEFRALEKIIPYLILPVIVTNAKLYTAIYDTVEVSLETGEFQDWPKELESEVPWIRFHKSFVGGRGRDVGARSIFIVNSMHFKKFLEHLEEAPIQPTALVSVAE